MVVEEKLIIAKEHFFCGEISFENTHGLWRIIQTCCDWNFFSSLPEEMFKSFAFRIQTPVMLRQRRNPKEKKKKFGRTGDLAEPFNNQ